MYPTCKSTPWMEPTSFVCHLKMQKLQHKSWWMICHTEHILLSPKVTILCLLLRRLRVFGEDHSQPHFEYLWLFMLQLKRIPDVWRAK